MLLIFLSDWVKCGFIRTFHNLSKMKLQNLSNMLLCLVLTVGMGIRQREWDGSGLAKGLSSVSWLSSLG